MSYDDRDDELDAAIKALHPSLAPWKCPCCGSDKIIPNATVTGAPSQLMVTVMAEPNAMLFKGYESEPISPRLCGECGYVAFFSDNPGRLWAVYQKSIKKSLGMES